MRILLVLRFIDRIEKVNAQEKFMRIKHAYNALMNPGPRQRSNYSYSTERTQSRSAQEEEEFYGFGNFVKDVQITIEDLFRDLQAEFQSGSQGKPKSLWEELADIGEEFVEFLEKELNITDPNLKEENNNEGPVKGNTYSNTRSEGQGSDLRNEVSKEGTIEDSIDEVEATLAKLKRELGL
ncbi:hypothetical protein GIB67_034004 [Kingdonia uniflora]|uniref:Uncharacterized protein n=1 Tax=Kingdonia uniflora TaxID=39325 RepID=A0A7J7M610_9MAGN|nr:hypothetical protein GIB67_034004 [Kingdonia uniflora]